MVRGLSFQSGYRCQRSGACCTSNWPIPVEADRLARMQAAVASGALRLRGGMSGSWLRDADASGDTPPILAVDHGACVFFDATNGHACRLQSALGHDALPLACRQFPRVSVQDPRGTSVVLSCYCPTVAALLDTPGPVTIVESSSGFPTEGEYVGLDTRDGWPPILRAGVLMDWPSWWAFEARAVNLIANVASSPEDALARLAVIIERLRAWESNRGSLSAAVAAAFDDADAATADAGAPDAAANRARVTALHAAIPPEWRVSVDPTPPVREPTIRQLRFLACHAFANWAVHLGDDLRSWLESLRTAHALLASGFGVREADLWLRHLTPAVGLRDGSR